MPYKRFLGLRRTAPLGCVIAALACSVPTAALAAPGPPPMPASGTGVLSTDSASCTAPVLSQPFLAEKDSNWYTLVPGESPGQITGQGWTLGNGASITTTLGSDLRTHSVINLPSHAYAITPAICVTSAYPSARTMVHNVVGSEGVQMYVSYEGTNTWMNPQNTGQFHSSMLTWALSNDLNLQPANTAGWQIARFVFVAGGSASDFQMYDFWVDPRMKG